MSNHRDEIVRRTLETSRETLDRLQDFRVSEPTFESRWLDPPEPEPEPRMRKLDTNPNAHLQQQVEWLTAKLAEVLPAIDTFMTNVNRSWSELKARAETAEKQLAEIDKRLADQHQRINLDIRAMELGLRSDILDLREARHREHNGQ